MDTDVRAVMHACTKASDEQRISFPQVVTKLMEAGIERYHGDLLRPQKTYYMPTGESEVVPAIRSKVFLRRISLLPVSWPPFGPSSLTKSNIENSASASSRLVGYFVTLAGPRTAIMAVSATAMSRGFRRQSDKFK
jgi:hypothetical protein